MQRSLARTAVSSFAHADGLARQPGREQLTIGGAACGIAIDYARRVPPRAASAPVGCSGPPVRPADRGLPEHALQRADRLPNTVP